MKNEELFEKMMYEKYFTPKDIMYNTKYNILLSTYDYNKFKEFKKSKIGIKESFLLPLKTFDNHDLHFFFCYDLINYQNILLNEIIKDYNDEQSFMNVRNNNEITLSRIYSEIEGSLEIENIPTTRKHIKEIHEGKIELIDKNDIIINNMIKGIEFVQTKPDFNKDNLFKLYTILSLNCLDQEDLLKDGDYYRYDGVEIDNFEGCPVHMIDECMDSLFSFVNNNLSNLNYRLVLPHIAHYYIALIHPYFDYNGRTARMVSLWISLLINNDFMPHVISDAINQKKSLYYNALRLTRTCDNDLTYFLIYIYKISISYFLTYKNIEHIEHSLYNNDYVINSTEKNYLKIILISSQTKFSVYDFISWTKADMSKQGGFKILNNFVKLGILITSDAKNGNKLFEINRQKIIYSAYNFLEE